jgi:tetratricopeptide (TPR) repeat protein
LEKNELAEKSDFKFNNKVQLDLVVKDYEKANELFPDFAFAWFNRGNALYLLQDYRTAIANYTKSIEKESDFAEAYFNRGLCYVKIGENSKGIEDLSKAGELGIYVAYNVIKRFRE